MAEVIVQIDQIFKSFGGQKILNGVSFSFEAGGFYSIIGKSGCGKSTLLRCLNGLETHDHGKISIDGMVIEKKENTNKNEAEELRKKYHEVRGHVGMVFQSFQLFPHMTLLENVKKPQMIVKQLSNEEATARAHDFLKKVGLSEHHFKYPYQLSGGQQQRGSIARALALKPRVMLYDEPTSALDPQLVDEVQNVMREIDNEGMTQIVVTHEMRFARDASDVVIYMDEGKIAESGPASELFSHPKEESTRQFLRKFL
ncbi:MAG: amino acid ABC transporter ATP-binding protein [Bacteriovoracaceae bacterium]